MLLEVVSIYAASGLGLTAATWAVVRLARGGGGRRWPEMTLVLGVGALVVFLATRGIRIGAFPATSMGEALALFSLSVGVCYLALTRSAENSSLGAFVIPIEAALATASAVLVSIAPKASVPPDNIFLAFHATTAFAAYAAFAFGAGTGAAYLIQERALKQKKLSRISSALPPLSVLDSLNYRAVALGFPLLTVSMVAGSIWAGRVWGGYWSWEPKMTLALCLWLLGAAIFHLRTVEKYQGRRTAILTIASGLMVLVVFLGAKFLPGGRHAFL